MSTSRQPSLFGSDTDDGPGAYGIRRRPDPAPLARDTDPETSHEAANRVRESGREDDQASRVAALVRRFPGFTTQELALRACIEDEFTDLTVHVIGRRMSTAERRGLVRRGEPRRCEVNGLRATTWDPVDGAR